MIQAIWKGCAPGNFRPGRPPGMRPEAIVIHIADGSAAGTDSWFNDKVSKVSAHYLVTRAGEVHQYVREADTAFHAGIVVAPSWSLLKPDVNPNFYTIGIEHEGNADDVWPDVQFATSAALLVEVATCWRIELDVAHVIGHHMIRSTKACPGNYITPQMLLAAVSAGTYAAAAVTQVGETVAPLRVRQNASTESAILRLLPLGARISITSTTPGQAVSGNSTWFAVQPEGYIWSGGVRMV